MHIVKQTQIRIKNNFYSANNVQANRRLKCHHPLVATHKVQSINQSIQNF